MYLIHIVIHVSRYHSVIQIAGDFMSGILFRTGAESLSIPALGLIQHPVGPGIVSLEVKRLECEADHIRRMGKLRMRGALPPHHTSSPPWYGNKDNLCIVRKIF
jgi:hypothetical protein